MILRYVIEKPVNMLHGWRCVQAAQWNEHNARLSFSLCLILFFSSCSVLLVLLSILNKINIFGFYSTFSLATRTRSSAFSFLQVYRVLLSLSCVCVCLSNLFGYKFCVAYIPFTHIIGIRELSMRIPHLHIHLPFLVLLLSFCFVSFRCSFKKKKKKKPFTQILLTSRIINFLMTLLASFSCFCLMIVVLVLLFFFFVIKFPARTLSHSSRTSTSSFMRTSLLFRSIAFFFCHLLHIFLSFFDAVEI